MKKLFLIILVTFCVGQLIANDKPFMVRNAQADDFENVINSAIEHAGSTFDEARDRYTTKFAKQAKFFCTIRLADARGRVEQVFIEVTSFIAPIQGIIHNEINYVQGYVKGQLVTFDAGDVLDWTIKFNDGRTEGNFIGQAIKKWQAAQQIDKL